MTAGAAAAGAPILECTGMPCPRPIIELGRHIDDVEVGGLLGVRADDPAAAVDVPAWCRMRGHEYVARDPANGNGSDGAAPVYWVRRCGATSVADSSP